MLLFILGLMLGSCLGVLLIAMMVKSKEADETIFGFMEEKDRVSQECVPATFQSII